MMCQVQHVLRQVGGLDDAADLERALILDERAHRVKELGENSLYQRYCHVTSRMVAATVSRVFLFFSNTRKMPVRAFGLKRWERQARYASTASSVCWSRSARLPSISLSLRRFLHTACSGRGTEPSAYARWCKRGGPRTGP